MFQLYGLKSFEIKLIKQVQILRMIYQFMVKNMGKVNKHYTLRAFA